MRLCIKVGLAVLVLAACGTPAASAAGGGSTGLPFVENDYDKALAQARSQKLPLFVEAWAPW
jgi:hypothetical protein